MEVIYSKRHNHYHKEYFLTWPFFLSLLISQSASLSNASSYTTRSLKYSFSSIQSLILFMSSLSLTLFFLKLGSYLGVSIWLMLLVCVPVIYENFPPMEECRVSLVRLPSHTIVPAYYFACSMSSEGLLCFQGIMVSIVCLWTSIAASSDEFWFISQIRNVLRESSAALSLSVEVDLYKCVFWSVRSPPSFSASDLTKNIT